MDDLFDEHLTDQDKVCERIVGRFDEDYEVFKCPTCETVYLTDYEDGTFFVDPSDFSKQAADHSFRCPRCGWMMQDGDITLGPKADTRFRPTVAEVRGSPWAWIMKSA